VNFSRPANESQARKWVWGILAGIVALQLYYVRAMLTALLLFTVGFSLVALVGLVIFIMDRAGQRSLAWVEAHSGPAVRVARRGWILVEDISRRPFRRPRSEPAQ